MRARICAAVILSGCVLGGAPAHADGSPVFVIPGKPGVPVIVNPYGFDASYTVVEGDFGLSRPGQVNPTIIAGPHVLPAPVGGGYYFPRTGRNPGYGRYEIRPPPNRRVLAPAQSYHRSWGASSDPLPASTDPPYPLTIQPVIGPWGPWGGGGGRYHRGR
jgi:hypothetical protein